MHGGYICRYIYIERERAREGSSVHDAKHDSNDLGLLETAKTGSCCCHAFQKQKVQTKEDT